MKVTLNWLKQYVDFNWSPEETTERLTMLGLEVEGVQKISGAFDGIVVAQVIARDKHPNADKLKQCLVNTGKEQLQVVCGAPNKSNAHTKTAGAIIRRRPPLNN